LDKDKVDDDDGVVLCVCRHTWQAWRAT